MAALVGKDVYVNNGVYPYEELSNIYPFCLLEGLSDLTATPASFTLVHK